MRLLARLLFFSRLVRSPVSDVIRRTHIHPECHSFASTRKSVFTTSSHSAAYTFFYVFVCLCVCTSARVLHENACALFRFRIE